MNKTSWVRQVEHMALRVLSLVFSAVSAHAILWFYSSMDKVADSADPLQPFVKWGLALGFTALGYFLSRGLVHRLLNKEPVRVYLVLFLGLELVEFSANFAQAAVAVHGVDWLALFTGQVVLFHVLQLMVYLVMPITPFFTGAIAVVDMDMDRAKQGYVVQGFGQPAGSSQGAAPKGVVPLKQPSSFVSGLPTTVLGGPQASYPVMSAPVVASAGQSGGGNRLQRFWDAVRTGAVPAPSKSAADLQGMPPIP